RSVRDDARSLAQATSALSTRLQRAPSEAEIADELGLSSHELRTARRRIDCAEVTSLDRPIGDDHGEDERPTLMDSLPSASRANDPVASVERIAVRELLMRATDVLTEKERAVLALHYYEGLSFVEIAPLLGVSGSRVSQLHAKATRRLNELLADERAAGLL